MPSPLSAVQVQRSKPQSADRQKLCRYVSALTLFVLLTLMGQNLIRSSFMLSQQKHKLSVSLAASSFLTTGDGQNIWALLTRNGEWKTEEKTQDRKEGTKVVRQVVEESIIEPQQNSQVSPKDKRQSHSDKKGKNNGTIDYFFLRHGTPDGVDSANLYSGAWWQQSQNVLRIAMQRIRNREGASTQAFEAAGLQKVLQTRNWLGLTVEHMSTYYKFFTPLDQPEQNVPYSSILHKLKRYLHNVTSLVHHDSGNDDVPPLSSTIVSVPATTLGVIPYTPGKNVKDKSIKTYTLAATLASMEQVGIGRAVVVVASSDHEASVQDAFDLLSSETSSMMHQHGTRTARPPKRSRRMELSCTQLQDSTFAQTVALTGNLPKGTLMDLQLILNGNYSSTLVQQQTRLHEWVGNSTARAYNKAPTMHDRAVAVQGSWKYVYFSEPDLILTSSAAALPFLTVALQDGHCLAPHRLQPLPHQADIPAASGYAHQERVLPAVGHFAILHDLDPITSGDACCDDGPAKPGFTNRNCGGRWWQCGFLGKSRSGRNLSDPAVAESLHSLKLDYPMVRVTTGFGAPVVGQHGRICHPKKSVDGICGAVVTSK